MNGYFFQASPKIVGYIIPWAGTKVSVYSKPRRFHLWAMRVCFGWKWEDAK